MVPLAENCVHLVERRLKLLQALANKEIGIIATIPRGQIDSSIRKILHVKTLSIIIRKELA